MKKILPIVFVLLTLKTFGQDMLYLSNGNSVPGKIIEIKKDSVKFINLANPTEHIFTYAAADIQFAFNAAGNYLIFNPAKPFKDIEKHEFIEANAMLRPFDIVVDLNGKLSTINITSETESKISDGKVNLNKDSLAYIIRKNNNHELFCDADRTIPFLIKCKLKIDSLLDHTPSVPNIVSTSEIGQNEYVVPDMKLVGRKAIAKVQMLTDYLQAINSGKIHSDYVDGIFYDERHPLFINYGRDARIEVSQVETRNKSTYLVGYYLNRMIKKTGEFDKLIVKYADFYYATKFRKGPNGNYYGTVTFSQKIQCFEDGNFVYGNKIKQNIEFALPALSGPEPEGLTGWIVFLDNIGVAETEKL